MKENIQRLIRSIQEGNEDSEVLRALCRELIRSGYGDFLPMGFFKGEFDWFETLTEMHKYVGKTQSVIVQFWEESERGWGTRPDGCSLHLSGEDCEHFIEEYLREQRKRLGEETPEEYERPEGMPTRRIIPLESLEELKKAKEEGKYGLRLGNEQTKKIGLHSHLSHIQV